MTNTIRRDDLTADYVRSRLSYNPATGVLRWKRRTDGPHWWNGKHAGKIAGTPMGCGYISIGIDGHQYLAHRLAFLIVEGRWPSHFIDHDEWDRSDNRWERIREATNAENLRNRGPTKGRKYKGVYPTLTSGKWYAYIMYEGKGQRLGTYETQEEAYEAFCKRARELHGKFLAI